MAIGAWSTVRINSRRAGTGNFRIILKIQIVAIGRVGSEAGSLICEAISLNLTAGICMEVENVKSLIDLVHSCIKAFKLVHTFYAITCKKWNSNEENIIMKKLKHARKGEAYTWLISPPGCLGRGYGTAAVILVGTS